MSGDRNWVVIGTAVGIVAIWYALSVGLYGVSANLYAGGKLSAQSFHTATVIFGGVLLAPAAAGVAVLLHWQRRNLRRAWSYVWVPLAVVGIVAVPIAALDLGNVFVMLLAILLAVWAVYMLSPRLEKNRQLWWRQTHEPWQYDFIEHLWDETTRQYATQTPRGKVVKRVTNARSGTEKGEAILEHPAERGETVIEYPITGIDRRITQLELHGSFGILQQCMDGAQLGVSNFPPNSRNTVRFEIRVNQEVVLQEDISDFGWRPVKVGPFKPQEGSLTVEFRTNSMGDPTSNWAAWSELKLLEPT